MERSYPPIAPGAAKITCVSDGIVYIITPVGLLSDPQTVADFNSMRWFEELEEYKFIDKMYPRHGRPHETQRECCSANAWAWQWWAKEKKRRRTTCTVSTTKTQSKSS